MLYFSSLMLLRPERFTKYPVLRLRDERMLLSKFVGVPAF